MSKMSDSASPFGTCRDVLLIAFAAGILFLPSLFTRELWNPDEPRYMEVGREMVLLDDYLVPHLNGELYPDKPPMFFWLAAGLYRMGFGLNAGRMVALTASLGTILFTYFLGRQLFSRQAGLVAALAVLTAGLFLATSKMGVIDPLLAFFTTASIYAGLRAMGNESLHFRQWWLASYAAAGLAVLTKGPVGLAVPLLVLVGCKHTLGRKARKGGWIHLAGSVVLLGMVGAWLVPALIRGGTAYSDNILFHQTAGRVWKSYSHRNPFYYYFLNSAWIFLPWALFLVPAVWSAVKAWRNSDGVSARVGLAWFGVVLVFFTLFSGKRAGYLMPIMPAFGLLMGRYFVLVNRRQHPWPRVHKILVAITLSFFAAGFLLSIPAAAMAGKISRLAYPEDAALAQEVLSVGRGVLPWTVGFAIIGAVIAAIGWHAGCRRDNPRRLFPAVFLLVALLSLFADLIVLPRINRFKSGKTLIQAGEAYLANADFLFLYHRDFDGVYNLYTRKVAIPVLKGIEELGTALTAPGKVAVIARENHAYEALGTPPRQGHIAAQTRVGHRRMLLIANWRQGDVNSSPQTLTARKRGKK